MRSFDGKTNYRARVKYSVLHLFDALIILFISPYEFDMEIYRLLQKTIV